MKRIWSILLTITVALTLLCPMTAYAATGEGNIGGGGGNLGDATSHGSWNPGNEGVRVTIVRSDDHAVVSTPIDLTNRAPAASIYHFGKVSKLQYTNGAALSPVQGSYTCIKPTQAVPRIISTNGRNNIEAIKSYFTDEQVIRAIANYSGMDFDTLIGGEYRPAVQRCRNRQRSTRIRSHSGSPPACSERGFLPRSCGIFPADGTS